MSLTAERGSVVAEFAVAMPAVLLVLATLLGSVQLGALQVRAEDASADAARSYARGESSAVVAGHLARQVPSAHFVRSSRGDLTCVTITVSPGGFVGSLGLRARGTACALSGGK